jgi:hypothetical protein
MKQIAVMVDVFLVHIFAMVKMIVVTIVTKVVEVSEIFSDKSLFFEMILSIYLAHGQGGKEILFSLYVGGSEISLNAQKKIILIISTQQHAALLI